MKKTFYIFFVLLFTSCGFSPILKNVDLSSVKINKIDFEGPSGGSKFSVAPIRSLGSTPIESPKCKQNLGKNKENRRKFGNRYFCTK